MSYRTSILCRRNLRAYAAAFIAYLMLAGQVAPLALGAAPRPRPAVAAAAATEPAPAKAAPQPAAPLPFAAPNVSAKKEDSFDDSVIPNGKAEPGQVITYTVTISNTGGADATGVSFSDSVDTNTTLNSGSINTQPITDPDVYAASGNIPIALNAAGGVLANDRDPDTGNNSGLTVTKVGANVGALSNANLGVATDTTAAGRGGVKGKVTLLSDGSFTYEPPPGYEGATPDTFAYEVTDGTSTDTNTVTINISGMAWFIQTGASGSNLGTFSNPFTTIGAFNTANAGTGAVPDPKNGDYIALRGGTYSEADGVNLRAQQKLIGNGVAFNSAFTAAANSSSAYTTFAGATAATTVNASAGNGVDLSTDNTVRGLTVNNTSGFDINGGAVGSPIINNVNLTGTGGAINVSTSGAFGSTVTFGTVESSSSTGANINLVGVTGTLGITSGGTGLAGSANASNAVNVSGGSVAFTYPGNVTKGAGATAALVSVAGGHATGTIAFSGTLSATAGTGLQFNNADGTYNFTGTTTLNGGDAGIDIIGGSGGTFSFNAGTTITSPSGTAFNVSTGTPNVTYSGTITDNTGSQFAVNVDSTTGGAVSINSVTTSTAGAPAAALTNKGINISDANANVTFTTLTLGTGTSRHTAQPVTITGSNSTSGTSTGTFNLGTVAIFTNGATGIGATNADGTINVTTGTIDASNAAAVNIDGPSNLTTLGVSLTRVDSVGGATNGISIQDTGGSFTITGSGGTCTNADTTGCSGGTISGKTGADGNTVGTGIFASNATNISLTRMKLNDFSNYAIRGTGVTGFTLLNSVFTGVNGSNAGADEGTIIFDGLFGTSTFSNNDIRGGFEDNFRIRDNTSGTANDIIISNNTIRDTSTGVSGNDNLVIECRGTSNCTTHVTGNTFAATNGDHVQTVVDNSATMNLVLTGNFYTGGGGVNALLQGFTISGGSDGSTETFNFDVSNNGTAANPLTGNIQGGAINVNKGNGSGNWQGRVNNNFIGNAAVPLSGSTQAGGIRVEHHGDAGALTALITNNTIRSWGTGPAINTQAGEAGNATNAGTLNITVTGNVASNAGPLTQHGFVANIGAAANASDTSVACVDVRTNDIDNPNNGGGGIRLRQRGNSTVKIPGYTGSQYDITAVQNYEATQNPSSSPSPQVGTSSTGPGYTNTSPAGSACAQPTVPTGPIFSSAVEAPVGPADAGVQSVGAPADVPSPVAKPRTVVALPSAAPAAPKAAAPVSVAPKAGKFEAKRAGGGVFRHTAEDSSAPLNAPEVEPLAQGRRKVSKPVQTDEPGPPNGSGGTVNVNIGTLRAGDSVVITFTATIDNPYGGGQNVSNQGTVSYGPGSNSVQTYDPATGSPANTTPTLTPVNATDIRINDATAAESASGTSQMLFTLTLTQPAGAGGLSVTYNTANGTATGGASCDGTADYLSVTNGTATVPQGSKVATIPITICNNSPGSNETFTVTISNASAGTIVDNVATGTITQGGTTAGTFLISELRTSGPGGSADDFVEFYNNTNVDLTVAASDASAGYGIFKMGATCADTPVLVGTILNGTVITKRGHYLAVGTGYTLANYGGTGAAAGNVTMTADIENDRNVAVFSTADVVNISSANRLDAVGFGTNTGAVCDLAREGTNLPPVSGSTFEYSFFRKECDFVGGTGCTAGGNPKDTNDNNADFMFADTAASNISGVPRKLGAPGPENLASPIRRDNSGIGAALLDGNVASQAHPNRTRTFGMGAANATFGTLIIRRRIVNNTGANVTRLRFRIVEMSTAPATVPGQADLRALSGTGDESVGSVTDQTTCTASGAGSAPCTVIVKPTTLEEPPSQTNGGGINSTLSAGNITLGTPLAPGASTNVRFVLGIETTGTFRFYIIVEALP